jgi:hypothetical protein
MSLDVYLKKVMPTEVYSANITHNLTKMASAVVLSNGQTLYQILWRPDECTPPYTTAGQIADLLDEGWNILLANPEEYKKYNPENGWGSYEGLCNFVYEYRNACWDDPDAQISVSR